MFEQSVVTSQRTKPWTFAASLTIEVAIAGAVILTSILQIQALDISVPRLPLFAPLHTAPEHVQIVATDRSGTYSHGPAIRTFRPLVAPNAIPKGIARVIDVPDGAPQLSDALFGNAKPYGDVGVVGAIGTSTISIPKPVPTPQPKPPAVENRKPVRISGGVMEGKLIRRVMPEYPKIARDMRISGTVRLVGVISKEGRVENLQVVEGHPLLVEAALTAVRQWLYRPTLLSGEPAEVICPIDVTFKLAQ